MGGSVYKPVVKGHNDGSIVDDEARLTDKERIFCAEYLANGMNAAKACQIAYPTSKLPSAIANRVLKRKRVKRYLGKLLQVRLKKTTLTADKVIRQLAIALTLDPLYVFEPGDVDGVHRVKSLDEIPLEIRQCISKLKCKTLETPIGVETSMEVEFIGKTKALELAMKYFNLLHEGAGVNVNIQNNNKQVINFDQLAVSSEAVTVDAIEVKLAQEEKADD